MIRMRLGLIARCMALSLQIVVVATVAAQPSPAGPNDTHWIVGSDAATDLWFHSMAVLGVSGPGTLPFYDAGYARDVAEERARGGGDPSLLVRDALRLKHEIMADSAFELLHFLPLYLDRTRPEDLPRLLRQVAASDATTLAPNDGLNAIRAALASKAQRAVVAELASAIEDEWRTFYGAHAAARANADAARRRALQARWDEIFAPRLTDVFRAIGLRRGVLLISPSLGLEGRLVNLGAAGVIIAVSDPSTAETLDAPLLASIRELCFPLLQRVWETDARARAHAARGAEESSGAAVQCGAQLVDALIPASGNEYRALYLRARPGESAAAYRRRFDQRFQADATTLRAMSAVLARGASRTAEPTP